MFCPFTKEDCKNGCAFRVSAFSAKGTTCLIADKLKEISNNQAIILQKLDSHN